MPPDITDITPSFGLLNAAMYFLGFGLTVIPVVPSTKRTAVKWDPWMENFSSKQVYDHWNAYPNHDVGFIVGDDIIVFDADTPESIEKLRQIERSHGIKPKLVVKTAKGEHHYFRREPGSIAKSDSHSTERFPDRIDVKTGRALVVLPPSGGKEVLVNEA